MQIMASLLFQFSLLSDWLDADMLWYKSGLDRGSCVAFGFATEKELQILNLLHHRNCKSKLKHAGLHGHHPSRQRSLCQVQNYLQ